MKHVDKPWGWERWWAQSDRYAGKLLFIRAGERLSLQYHEVKEETIYLHSGDLELQHGALGGALETTRMKPGDAFHILPLTVHRMVAVTDCEVFEASTTELDDVVRLEDAYGRVK